MHNQDMRYTLKAYCFLPIQEVAHERDGRVVPLCETYCEDLHARKVTRCQLGQQQPLSPWADGVIAREIVH